MWSSKEPKEMEEILNDTITAQELEVKNYILSILAIFIIIFSV